MLEETYPYYLAGEAVDTKDRLEVTNKYTGDVATRVARADRAAVEKAIGRAVEASSEVRDLSLRAFDEGATTFLDVIDAERVIVENQLQQAEAIRDWTSSYVQLQVSTGKGWLVGVDEIYVINRNGRAAATAAAFQ